MTEVSSVEALQDRVRSSAALLPRGGGTKTALSTPPEGFETVEMGGLEGVVDHQPDEYTVTVRAGTKIEKLRRTLAEAGQHLPFDPVLVDVGATVGGTVASGLAGSGRLRYGGVRDFVLGVTLVDGRGAVMRGGGRVVKNAAGFDLPKLMVGSAGSLGILTEVTFKVFPQHRHRATVQAELGDLGAAVAAIKELRRSHFELDALDCDHRGRLWVRLAGFEAALERRSEAVLAALGGGLRLAAEAERAHWSSHRELTWARGDTLIKVPVTPARIVALDEAVADHCAERVYAAGGQQAWLSLDDGDSVLAVDAILERLEMRGLVVLGTVASSLIGAGKEMPLVDRARDALDPEKRFRRLGSPTPRITSGVGAG